MCVAGSHVATTLGLRRRDLLPARMEISVANNAGLQILGAAYVTLSSNGVEAGHMLYFAENLREFFLSKEACKDLGIISHEFPAVGSHSHGSVNGTRRRRSSSAPPPLTGSADPGILGGSDFLSGKTSNVVQADCNDVSPMCNAADDLFLATTGVDDGIGVLG